MDNIFALSRDFRFFLLKEYNLLLYSVVKSRMHERYYGKNNTGMLFLPKNRPYIDASTQ